MDQIRVRHGQVGEMTHIHKHGMIDLIRRFARWLFGSPFRELSPVFGDQTPPDLRVFQAKVAEARREIQEVPAPPTVHAGRSKPVRWK